MKTMTKILGAAVLAGGAMIAASAPAAAQVSVGIGLGGGYYGPPPPAYSCDPYSRWYDPYRCGYPAYYAYPRYYGPAYYGPSIVIGGRFGGYHGGYHGGRRHR
jgi:hypothetical protein